MRDSVVSRPQFTSKEPRERTHPDHTNSTKSCSVIDVAWPMPASLMLGFRARLAPGVDPAGAVPDGEEIVELRWLSREEVAAADGEVGLPGRISIAAWLLEQWYGGPLPTDPPWPLS